VCGQFRGKAETARGPALAAVCLGQELVYLDGGLHVIKLTVLKAGVKFYWRIQLLFAGISRLDNPHGAC
jgi:hypothetical protein